MGCARGEQPDWGEGGKNLYITTTWQEISPSYVYYVAISTDSGLIPDSDPDRWNEFYVVKWEDHNFFLRKPGGSFSYFSSPSVSGQEMRVTLSLTDDLGDPNIIRVMVVSTDKGGIEKIIWMKQRCFDLGSRALNPGMINQEMQTQQPIFSP